MKLVIGDGFGQRPEVGEETSHGDPWGYLLEEVPGRGNSRGQGSEAWENMLRQLQREGEGSGDKREWRSSGAVPGKVLQLGANACGLCAVGIPERNDWVRLCVKGVRDRQEQECGAEAWCTC